MVSNATIVCICISLLISLILPILIPIIFGMKYKKKGMVSAWMLGAAGFFITQMLLRIPVLTVLQKTRWYTNFSQNHLLGYVLFLAVTAAVFELAGRYSVAKVLLKNPGYRRSLLAGLGHGGIEAIAIVGITMVNNLAYASMINAGTFRDTLVSAAAAGVDVSTLELIGQQLLNTAPGMFLLSGVERLLAMTAHVAMSMLVCYGVAHNKVRPCNWLCLGIHILIDMSTGLTMVLPQTTAYIVIYTILFAVALFSLWILRDIRRRWKETEAAHDAQ